MAAIVLHRRVPPSASIASFVESLVVIERDGDAPHVAIPRPEIDLLFRFGPAADGGCDAHAFGARQQVHRKTVRGVRRIVTARLRLGAPEVVLGVPSSAIAGRIVALDSLWGEAAARRTLDRLSGARDGSEAVALLDAAIAERIGSNAASHRSGALALEAADRLRDAAHVNTVADALGISERHLRRVFRDAFGVAPKAFAKLARFDRALCAARSDQRADWASIAAAAGYYDQAHLISEFRAIAGATPRALLGELRASSSIG